MNETPTPTQNSKLEKTDPTIEDIASIFVLRLLKDWDVICEFGQAVRKYIPGDQRCLLENIPQESYQQVYDDILSLVKKHNIDTRNRPLFLRYKGQWFNLGPMGD